MLGFTTGCISLSYDTPPPSAVDASVAPDGPATTGTEAGDGDPGAEPPGGDDAVRWPGNEPSAAAAPALRRETPTHSRLARRKAEAGQAEPARDWRSLSRLARESVLEGKFDDADRLLRQAALQLADRKPTHTPRRTVFNQRARLALDLFSFDKVEQADALADGLFEEARREPDLTGPALATLARTVAGRRTEAAKKAGREDAQLGLLALALETSQKGTANRDRLGLAFDVSNLALREGDLPLARRAIDQAMLDAEVIEPSDRIQAASLRIYKARIALAQKDLEAADASARSAKRIFEEVDANGSNRGVAEITLAQVMAEKGERDPGLELAQTAYQRLSGEEKLVIHARRLIAAGLARVERLAGDAEGARRHYRQALEEPSDKSPLDDDLIRSVESALSEIENASATTAPAPLAETN